MPLGPLAFILHPFTAPLPVPYAGVALEWAMIGLQSAAPSHVIG